MQRHIGRTDESDAEAVDRRALPQPSHVRDSRPASGEAATPADPDEVEQEPSRAGSPAVSAGWGLLGFLIGAVFWHFIGFWGFVSEVVYTGRPAGAERFVDQSGPQCSEVVLDRETGAILTRACPADAAQLNELTYAMREDFGGPRGVRTSARSGAAAPIRLSAGEK